MQRLIFLILMMLLWSGSEAWAACETHTSVPTYPNLAYLQIDPCDLNGGRYTDIITCLSGESACIGTSPSSFIMVQQRFTPSPLMTSSTQVKASAGFLHCIVISPNDAAPTAGQLTIYDNTAASGTKVFSHNFTTSSFSSYAVCPDIIMSVGIYVDFTTTADVNVLVSYQ